LHIHTNFQLNFRAKLDKAGLNTLLSSLQETRRTDQRHDSCRPKCTHAEENMDVVEQLTLGQEGWSHTRYREMSRYLGYRYQISISMGLSQSSVLVIICHDHGLKGCHMQELSENNRHAFITTDLWLSKSHDIIPTEGLRERTE